MARSARPRRVARSEAVLRQAILAATEDLLADQPFDEIRVEDILKASGVGRSSFYMYFESRYAVLGQLARDWLNEIAMGSWPWAEPEPGMTPREIVEQSARVGLLHWRTHSPILRAISENWRSHPELAALWIEILGNLTARTAARIDEARAAGFGTKRDADPEVLAGLLAVMTEGAQYLAAIGYEPFADDEQFVRGVAAVWYSVIYSSPELDEGQQAAD